MTSDLSPRQPAGTAIGGQFAAATHAESPVRLFDRGDGSFLKPSPSATAEHCIEFWSRIDVPDAVIDQVFDEYAVLRNSEISERLNEEMTAWSVEWKAANPSPKREGKELTRLQSRYLEEFDAHQASITDRIYQEHPNQLGAYDARQLVRATQMKLHRPHPVKFPEESEKVMNHQIELFDETLTVAEIDAKYRLTRIAHALQSIFPPKPNPDSQRALETLEQINTNLVHQRNDSMY